MGANGGTTKKPSSSLTGLLEFVVRVNVAHI
jgi:hypothetical protein